MSEERDRFRGCLAGLAVGDALGTTLEFMSRKAVLPIDDMVGGGPFDLEPGQWTDDTSMALCLAESLLECRGFDPADQMERYLRWFREGHWSATGACFDIGSTVLKALLAYERTGEPFSGPTHPRSAGNGSIMRLAPVVMFSYPDPGKAGDLAARSSRTTHGATESVDACRLFAVYLHRALAGAPGDEILRHDPGEMPPDLAPAIDEIAREAYREKTREEIRGSGYVVRSLEAAPGHTGRPSSPP